MAQESETEREMLSVHRDEIVPYALSSLLAQRHIFEIETEEKEREGSLAVQSAGKPFKEALKFSRGLGTALQKGLTLPKTRIESPEIFMWIYIFKTSGNVISGRGSN